jgi:Fic family protein
MTPISQMEPMLPEDRSHRLEDACADLIAGANSLASRLSPVLRASVGDLVRSMNCYYSNLIEGHDTHPVSIDRALAGNYSTDPHQRELQLEAQAHIEVQQMIDKGEAPSPAVSQAFIQWVHREFCRRLPEQLLWVENPETKERLPVIPGEYRTQYVKVGNHIPIAAEDIPAFLARFEERYSSPGLSKIQRIIAVAASHHRLVWIHPFLDGNGRVTRLFSHALLRELGIGSELWSVSRGLARSVDEYKRRLMGADELRRGDLDGRGNLSLSALENFCVYFLQTCIDQVSFMQSLLEPTDLLNRIQIWAEEETRAKRLPKGSWPLLREAVLAGSFSRGQAESLTGYEERQARSVLKSLLEQGFLVSETPRAPVRLGFPPTTLERWLPRLYPAFPRLP